MKKIVYFNCKNYWILDDGQDPYIKEENKITRVSAIITITKTIVGSTILCLPYILKTLGIVFGFIFLLINAIVGVVVVDLLLKCKDITKK